ncbi:MAG TPA: hypothetical protein PLQ76_01510 [bacterium]|nr:hypothetical protein [bacterium]
MPENGSVYFNIAVFVIAVCAVCVTAILYWVARNLILGSGSLKKLIETVDYNVHTIVDMLQKSIDDINGITQRAGEQMDKVSEIMEDAHQTAEDARQVAADAKSTMHMIETTVVPTLISVKSISAGLKKGLETWRENDPGAAPRENE